MQSETRHFTGRLDKHQVEELEKISREEKIDRSTALRKILDIGIGEYSKKKALDAYRKGKMSIGKASEEAKVSIQEFHKILEDENVAIRLDSRGLKNTQVGFRKRLEGFLFF